MESIAAVIRKIREVSIESRSKTLGDGHCGILCIGDLLEVVNSGFGGPAPLGCEACELQLPRSHDFAKQVTDLPASS